MSLGNTLATSVLRSPLHGVMSRSLLVLTYTGRRSGTNYTIPLQYIEHNGELCIWAGSADEKTWWRNFEKFGAVDVRLRGRDRTGKACVIDNPARRIDVLRAYLERFPYTSPSGRPKFFGSRWHPGKAELARVAESMVIVAITLD